MRFAPAPEYQVFPTRERPLKPYAAAARAAAETRPLVRDFAPHVVVNDVLTLAPALAAELEGRPRATLIPHFYPPSAPGLPPYGLGAMPPRTRLGRAAWGFAARQLGKGVERGRRELNETRRRVGLPELARPYGGISDELCLVATFPQLEYPRAWPEGVHVTGPVGWEPPTDPVTVPAGQDPLVLIAPSTSQDREERLLRTALEGLARLPVRVLAARNRHPARPGAEWPSPVPANAKLVDWISYSQVMPQSAIVVCHAGHGTMVRALASGAAVVTVPVSGDRGENGVRAQWAGAGLNLPARFLSPATLRWAVRSVLEHPRFAARARELSAWATQNDGTVHAALLVERFATRASRS
jgi:UDP:flavonoid glycosyltransferase YjiC (YdhE family)